MCLDSLFDRFYACYCLHNFFCIRIYAVCTWKCLWFFKHSCKEAFPEVLTFTFVFNPARSPWILIWWSNIYKYISNPFDLLHASVSVLALSHKFFKKYCTVRKLSRVYSQTTVNFIYACGDTLSWIIYSFTLVCEQLLLDQKPLLEFHFICEGQHQSPKNFTVTLQ